MADNPIYDPRERELFEATMRKDRYHDFAFYEPGNIYNNLFTQAAWLAWQRRAALGVTRNELPESRDSQHVLKAEAARPDATDREHPGMASPVGGPMGAGQPAAAGPFGAGAATGCSVLVECSGCGACADGVEQLRNVTADEDRWLRNAARRGAKVVAPGKLKDASDGVPGAGKTVDGGM